MNKPKVLITGASGLIGGITFGNLSHKYEFTALNRSYVSEIPTLQADITDLDSIMPAFENIDIVLIYSDFNINFKIKRNNLFSILSKEYNIVEMTHHIILLLLVDVFINR